ncbi:hypothetical protein ScalyP_jg6062 [Parmales sp. scaly parma]|nr:hypothetical protein ScalyP_jg6062 [Parmales sp. scaly parma]
MMAPTNTGTDAPPRPEDEVDDIMDDSKPLLAGSKSGFHTDYDIGTDLGSGSFSVVKAATHRETGNIVAVKCIRRASLPADEREALRDEVSILRELDHPNIIAMHDFYEEEQNFYLVMEVMEGGELFDRIVQKSYYNEKEARDLVKILLNSMQYLHVRNIVHRDLKPENLLLANKQDDSNIRLADFGFAKRVIKPLKTQCGTPGYVAPEILRGDTYGLSVDMWSIGVITYILLGGYPPFHDDNQSVLYKKIKAGEFVFHPEYWDPVSPEAKDLITRMLCVDHTKRLTAEDALDHPWIAGMSDQELQAHDLNGTLTEIRKFNARRKLKGTIKAVMAATKMKRLLEGLTRAGSSMSLEEKKSAEEKLRVESVKVLQKMYRQWKERKTEREGGCEAVETSAPEVTS